MSVGTRNYLFDNQGYLSPDKQRPDDSDEKFYHSMVTSPERRTQIYHQPLLNRQYQLNEKDELKFKIQNLCREYNNKYSENVWLEFASSPYRAPFPEYEFEESPTVVRREDSERNAQTPQKQTSVWPNEYIQEVKQFQKSSSKIRDSIQSAKHLINSLKGKSESEVDYQEDSNPALEKIKQNAEALQNSIDKLQHVNRDFCDILMNLKNTITSLNQKCMD